MKTNTYNYYEDCLKETMGDFISEDGEIDWDGYYKAKAKKDRKTKIKMWIAAGIAVITMIFIGVSGMGCGHSTRYKTAEQKQAHKAYINSDVKDYVSEAEFAEVYGIYRGWN